MTFSTLASPGVSLQGGGGSGGGGTPGGSDTQIQYNSSGTFAGASGLTTNGTELTIASGTVTTSSPVIDAAQTWNDGAVTFTGLKFNATDTDSAAASLLMDLQVGGTSQFSVHKDGVVSFPGNSIVNASGTFAAGGAGGGLATATTGLFLSNTNEIKWSSSGTWGGTSDTFLTRRGAANLRLGAADTTGTTAPTPQFLSAQSWLSSTTDDQTGADFTIDGSQGTGTGAGGSIIFRVAPAGGTSNGVQNGLATAWSISGAGNLLAGTDNTYDIGASGATRPRNVYVAGVTTTGSLIASIVRSSNFNTENNTHTVLSFTNSSDNLLFATGGTSPRINFCGTSAAFPALKRSTTVLQAVLADDTGFATIQGKLRADVNAVAETPVATHTITITDAAGTAYKVLCVAA